MNLGASDSSVGPSSLSSPKRGASYPKTAHETHISENSKPKQRVKRSSNSEMLKGQESQPKKPKKFDVA